MTGIGRTGKWFGIQHWNVCPNIIITGKGISCGYTPMACIMASEKVLKPIREGSGFGLLGHTYSECIRFG